jgi:phosphatidylglycerophosphate synthase
MTSLPITIPNLLSGARLASVPVLLVLAWLGLSGPFLILFVIALLSDMVDGYLARKLNQESEFGARLDSLGDFTLYMSTPLCAWWLWPEIILREAPYVVAVLTSFIVPILIGFIKYRRLTSYHTWGAKLSAVLMGVGTFLLFAGGPVYLFRFSTIILIIAQIEEIAMTFVLREWHADVPSLWHAVRIMRKHNVGIR